MRSRSRGLKRAPDESRLSYYWKKAKRGLVPIALGTATALGLSNYASRHPEKVTAAKKMVSSAFKSSSKTIESPSQRAVRVLREETAAKADRNRLTARRGDIEGYFYRRELSKIMAENRTKGDATLQEQKKAGGRAGIYRDWLLDHDPSFGQMSREEFEMAVADGSLDRALREAIRAQEEKQGR